MWLTSFLMIYEKKENGKHNPKVSSNVLKSSSESKLVEQIRSLPC